MQLGTNFMAFKLFSKKPKKRYLALDIGSQNTKIMLLEPGRVSVDKLVMKPTPADTFKGGVVTNEELLCNFLTECVTELEVEDEMSVITGISGKGVIAKKIDIPQMEEGMIPEFVEIEAEQEIFYNKEEMELDYDMLTGVNFKKPEAQSLLVVTVLKQIIESYNNVIQKSFMNCEILDTNFAALFNSFEYSENLDERKSYLVLDVGCSSTNLVIVIKNQIVFARNLPIGGEFFNQGIQKKMGINYQEAEELKISASNGQEAPKDLVSLITDELNEAFTEEILSCYELYHSLFPDQQVDYAYITGGGSRTLGLISHLQKKINLSINDFNPFKKIELKPNLRAQQEELKSFSAVVTGLALRSIS